MFKDTWKKYLPVIAILLKRSVRGDQMLNLDAADFMRAAGGRKMRFSFSNVKLVNGRIETGAALTPMAREFAQALLESDMIRLLVKNQEFVFELNSDFQLSIKQVATREEPVEDTGA